VILSLLWLFLLVLWFWILITVFIDIFRREDLSGWAKAGWTILIIFIPLIGILIYLIVRPKNLEQDQREAEAYQAAARRQSGYSSADEIQKLSDLHAQGTISDEEFEEMKKKAM